MKVTLFTEPKFKNRFNAENINIYIYIVLH